MTLNFYSYKIPFKASFKTAGQDFHGRKGIFIQLKKDQITAWGEAAPLPGFSKENLEQVARQINQHNLKLKHFFTTDFIFSDLNDLLDSLNIVPSLQFGLFTVTATYLAQKNSKSLHHFLFDKNCKDSLPINAVIDLNKRNVLAETQKYVDRGFKTIKLKVGNHWQDTLSHIKTIQNEFSKLKIRLDANRSWQIDEAKDCLKQAEELNIEYCEEPLAQITAQKLQFLKQATQVSIALDETMARWDETDKLLLAADIFVIKPAVVGYCNIKEIVNFACKNNKQLVFTTALGSAIARLATASLAAGYGSGSLAHGLNTASLLSNDVWDDTSVIKNGFYTLPNYARLKKLMESVEMSSHITAEFTI